jgi:hypothetical protein
MTTDKYLNDGKNGDEYDMTIHKEYSTVLRKVSDL